SGMEAFSARGGSQREDALSIRTVAHERESDRERRSQSLARAGGLDRSTMQLDEIPHDGDPHPEPAMLAGPRDICLPEALEDVRQNLGCDAFSLVAHGDDDLLVEGGELHDGAPSLSGELHRVGHEVPHDLLQTGRIAPDLSLSELELRFEPD